MIFEQKNSPVNPGRFMLILLFQKNLWCQEKTRFILLTLCYKMFYWRAIFLDTPVIPHSLHLFRSSSAQRGPNALIDEAQDYFDRNIGLILSQARKYQVGMTMAHQYLGQLSSGLQEAFEANTSIKLAGGVSARDARALAGQMSSDPETNQRQPKGTFATYVRDLTQRAVPISFPFFVLEKLPRATKTEIEAIRQHSRTAYAEPWQRKAEEGGTPADEPSEPPQKIEPDDPTKPSPEL